MPELTSPSASSSSLASAASTIRASRPSPSRTMRPYARASSGSNDEHRGGGCGARVRVDEREHRLGRERGHVAVQHEHVSVRALERGARCAHGVAGAELASFLDRHLAEVVVRASRAVGRRDQAGDDLRDARIATAGDHPVDHATAQERVQVLRRRALHARAPRPPACITTAARSSAMSSESNEEWLGREDSNLRSRDQNPLPYHLATPHQGSESLAPVK